MVQRWSSRNKIPINQQKSGVLELRVDQRTRRSMLSPINIPLVREYRYLGILIRDDLNMILDAEGDEVPNGCP